MKMIRKLAALLLLLTVLAAVPAARAQDDGGSPREPFGPSRRILTHIERVDVIPLAALPPELRLIVKGENRDGCDFPVQVRQIRFRNRVLVRIFRIQPAGMMCPSVLQPYEASVQLYGVFEPGVYQIDVNGVIVEFES